MVSRKPVPQSQSKTTAIAVFFVICTFICLREPKQADWPRQRAVSCPEICILAQCVKQMSSYLDVMLSGRRPGFGRVEPKHPYRTQRGMVHEWPFDSLRSLRVTPDIRFSVAHCVLLSALKCDALHQFIALFCLEYRRCGCNTTPKTTLRKQPELPRRGVPAPFSITLHRMLRIRQILKILEPFPTSSIVSLNKRDGLTTSRSAESFVA